MSLNIVQSEVAVRHAISSPLAAPRAQVPPASLLAHLALVRDIGVSLKFERNATIFHENDPAHHVFQIVSGVIRLCRHTADGRRHIAQFALPGDLIGVFGGTAQAFTAEAVGDAMLISYPRIQLDRLAERDPNFRANVLAHLSTDLLAAQLHTFTLGCRSAKERLAAFLVRLAERSGVRDSGRLSVPMGRQDIADHLGLTIETVCRALTSLKNEGLLGIPGPHQLSLRNVEALNDFAEGGALH